MNTKANTIIQESLQPIRISREEKAYQSVLDIEERLRKGDATNIALTGPFGSGKSSILTSLKKDYSEYEYLNISLATLQPFAEIGDQAHLAADENGEISKDNLDRLIEYSILQQLIYRENQETLPYSRFKRVFHLSSKKVSTIAISTLAAIIALVVLFEPAFVHVEWLCNLLGKSWMNVIGDVASLVYLLFYAYWALRIIVPALSNSRLNKFNLKNGEIEIVKNTSIFNKHLDEILYFFEKTNYNVVVLEDLDRFNSTAIFLKLRELNLLLNESKVINRTIFFIYAVRDDMFENEDRVKCFDYITTVIPVINRSNAKDQLKEELERRGVNEIKDVTLRELGFFLHDMRLLKNIANEYVQYRGKLEKGISCDKLLAMIVYKNYYPRDFAELHDCKGVVYQLINLKEKFVAAKVAELEEENKRQQEKRMTYQKEKHLSERELRRIYVDEYKDKLGDNVLQIKIGDSFYSLKDIASNEKLFDKLVSNDNVTYSYLYGGRTQHNTIVIAFNEIEKAVNPNNSYKDRVEALTESFDELETELVFEMKKAEVRSQSLSRIMSGMDYSSVQEFIELKVPKLIEYLVVNGYIDENYYDYISYFYAGFIDSNDWVFVLDLKLGRPHEYNYVVHNVEACLQEIPDSVYSKKEILNISIVDYLAEKINVQNNAIRLSIVLKTVVDNKEYDFLIAYFEMGHMQKDVFQTLFSQNKGLWGEFERYDDKNNGLKLIWYEYAEEELSCPDSRKWLAQHYSFITSHLRDVEQEKWCALIKKYGYQFIELNGVSADVLKAVAVNNSYELTRRNVQTLVSYFLKNNIVSISYRLVLETEDEQLIARVETNLNQCLDSIFSAPENECETGEAIVKILKSEVVPEKNKINYLTRQTTNIEFVSLDTDELRTLALKSDVIEPSWANVVYYMKTVCEKKTNNDLVAFVEKHVAELAGQSVENELEEDERMLLNQLVLTDVLSYESYRQLLNQFVKWKIADVPTIEEGRVLLLIEYNMLPFNDENTRNLLSFYTEKSIIAYLIKNKREFLKNPEKVDFTADIALGTLKANLTVREKALIIPHFTKDILNVSLANEIMGVLILKEIPLDLPFLIKVMSLSNKTAEKIGVLGYLLEKNTYNKATITAFLVTLPEKYKEIAEKGKKPEIPNNDRTLRLVKRLKEVGYISSYSETRKGIRVNTKLK